MKVGKEINSQMCAMNLDEQTKQQTPGDSGASIGPTEPSNDTQCDAQCCGDVDDDVMTCQAMMDARGQARAGDGMGKEHHAMHHGHNPMGYWPRMGPMGPMQHPPPHMGPMGPMAHPYLMGHRPQKGCRHHMRRPMPGMTSQYPVTSAHGHPGMMTMPPMFALAQQHHMMKMWHKMMKKSCKRERRHGSTRCRKDNAPDESSPQDANMQSMEGDLNQVQNNEQKQTVEESASSSDSDQSGSSDDDMMAMMTMMMMPPWGMRGMNHFRQRMFKRGRHCERRNKHGKSDSEPETTCTQKPHDQKGCPRMHRRWNFSDKMCARKCHRKRGCRVEKAQEVTESVAPESEPVASASMEHDK